MQGYCGYSGVLLGTHAGVLSTAGTHFWMTALSARLAFVLRSLDDSSLMYTCSAARPVLSGHSEYSIPSDILWGTYAHGGDSEYSSWALESTHRR